MKTSSPLRPLYALLSLSVLVAAHLLVMANSAPPDCEYSKDFDGRFDVATDCGLQSPGKRTGRIHIYADGSEQAGQGEWQATVETESGAEIVAKVIAIGGCDFDEPAEVDAFRLYLTEDATTDLVGFVCGSSVRGTKETSCDEEKACVGGDCDERQNACTVSLDPVVPGT